MTPDSEVFDCDFWVLKKDAIWKKKVVLIANLGQENFCCRYIGFYADFKYVISFIVSHVVLVLCHDNV